MTPTRSFRRAALVASALPATLTLASCGDTDATATGSAGAAQVTSIGGEQLATPGDKPTAVFFFSVGCGECVGGVRSLGEAAQSAQDTGIEASFLAMDMDPGESEEIIEAFMEYVDAEHVPAAIDEGAALSQRFDVAALSTHAYRLRRYARECRSPSVHGRADVRSVHGELVVGIRFFNEVRTSTGLRRFRI